MKCKRLPWIATISGVAMLLLVLLGMLASAMRPLTAHRKARAAIEAAGGECNVETGHWMDENDWGFIQDWSPGLTVNVSIDKDVKSPDVLQHLPHIFNLDRLIVFDRTMSEADIVAIAQVDSVTELDLLNCVVQNRQLQALQRLPQLKRLCVVGATIDADALETLGSFPALEWLHVGRTDISEESIRAFAQTRPSMTITWFPRLSPRQQAVRTELGAAGIDIHLHYPTGNIVSKGTAEVSINEPPASPAKTVEKLAILGQVESVIISDRAISDELLVEVSRFEYMHTLWLEGSSFTMDGLEALLACKKLERLICSQQEHLPTEDLYWFRRQFRGEFMDGH